MCTLLKVKKYMESTVPRRLYPECVTVLINIFFQCAYNEILEILARSA